MTKINAVLFDLDGTLLPMDQDRFAQTYFRLLAAKLAPRGYEPKALMEGIWSGTKAMVLNDGSRNNEEAFWADFTARFGETAREDLPLFDEFYRVDFQQVRQVCGYQPDARKAIRILQEKGLAAGELPETWNLTHQEQITEIAYAYLEAGADIINMNTFGQIGIKGL